MRFLAQVTTDNICLTGMKFFSVTRSLVLTVRIERKHKIINLVNIINLET